MSKINVTKFAVNEQFMFVIDDGGRVWRRGLVATSEWKQIDELPQAPATTAVSEV